jgi:hypothetical protein
MIPLRVTKGTFLSHAVSFIDGCFLNRKYINDRSVGGETLEIISASQGSGETAT